MSGYTPGEQPEAPGLIKLNTNENPYPPSPRVQEAVASLGEERLRLYPSPGAGPLRRKAADVYGRSPANILIGNGSDDLLAICMRVAVDEGATVAYPVPTYSLYPTLTDIARARAVEIPSSDGDETLADRLVAAEAALTFVCSPNPPKGSLVAADVIAGVAEGSAGLVVADEAYGDFADLNTLDLLDEHPNLVVVRSLSKSFSLAGLRLGLAFASEQLIHEMYKVKDSYNVSSVAIAAGVAALDDLGWMQANVARIRSTRDKCVSRLRRSGYEIPDSHANFFWLEHPGRPGEELYGHLRSEGILVRYFDTPELRGGIRVTVGTDSEMSALQEALAPLAPR